jgi:superfamily II DNA or RNA helicase
VSLLRDTNWQLKYTPDDGSLVRAFYVPALTSAVRYDRLTGYFTARALTLAARGVEGLVVNNGRMRMVVGCTLAEEEAAAIQRGEELRATVQQHLLKMPLLTAEGQEEKDALELLSWMVAKGHLDVRVAIPCDDDRRPVSDNSIFHEKTGIIEDKTGDRIAFTGSVNESANGWTRNWESFSVYTSWNDAPRVDLEESSFLKIWSDRARRVITVDVPTAVRDQLMTFLPDPDRVPRRIEALGAGEGRHVVRPEPQQDVLPAVPAPMPALLEEERRAIWERIASAALQPIGGDRVGEATSAVVPWPHQIRAFDRMYGQWPPKLLIADEVGLGKTVQAGLLLRQAWLAGRARRILILAPKNVCKQWQLELREKFNLSWPVYDGHKLSWLPSPGRTNSIEQPVGRDEWHREPFVIMSSHLARRRERQRELLEVAADWDLVILDEAHHARTRGAGTSQSKGPNRLLQLMRGLRDKTQGLVLLTATPLQVDVTELWDLLDLLGLPAAWTKEAFARFFTEVSKPNVTGDALEWLSTLFRATEATYRPTDGLYVEHLTGMSRLKSRKILSALRDAAAIPRQMLSAEEKRAAVQVIKKITPVRSLVSRHTRELLRRYFKAGKISTPVATRQVEDVFIPLSKEEEALYQTVEGYISETYNSASPDARNAVGFVMTIYRRRLASSFYALRKTLENRRAGVVDERRLEEDAADETEAGEDTDIDQLRDDEREAMKSEEIADIGGIIESIGRLPVDTKAAQLRQVIDELQDTGYRQVMVFTQFTDTMDYLRGLLVDEGRSVMCFSGRGGEIMSSDGTWSQISRDQVKRRFREGGADILLCTDAAAEGLNFQFCGALVNYDMPWNPMRVEQRIGRIDRLGQRFADIRIINLHYEDTVEADVYRALRARIRVFESVVGGLQPILARLPGLIGATVLAQDHGQHKRDEAVGTIDAAIAAGGQGIDLGDFADEDLELPIRPEPALTLADLRSVLERPSMLPPPADATMLDGKDFTYLDGTLESAIRVTVDRDFYEQHGESVEFWTPGSPVFPDLDQYRSA